MRKCQNCGKDLPGASSLRRKFCDDACRFAKWKKTNYIPAKGDEGKIYAKSPSQT